MTPDEVLDLVASRSYVITLADEERAAVLAAVAALLREHPDLTGAKTIHLPYRTRSWRARLG